MKGEPKRQAPECAALHKLFFPPFFLVSLLLLLSFSISLSTSPSMLQCFKVFVQHVWGKGQVKRKQKSLPINTVKLTRLSIVFVL